MTSAEDALERFRVVNDVCLTSRCLFVVDSRSGEMPMNYLIADYSDLRRIKNLAGKYVKRMGSYVRVHENGSADMVRELPEGVTASDVVPDDLEGSTATPLQDRLRAIAQFLRSGATKIDDATAMAGGIDRILNACRPDNGERLWGQIKEWASAALEGSGELTDMKESERVHWFLDQLGELARELQTGPFGDGETIGGILAIRAIMLAAAAEVTNEFDEVLLLMTPLFYVMSLLPDRLENVAGALTSYLVRRGGAEFVRHAAESLKAEGDAHIAGALGGDALMFYMSLYPAAAYELAVVSIGQAGAAAISDPDEQKRWARLAVNAEERAVRVATALAFALTNLDGSWRRFHQSWLQHVRDEEGDEVARLKARDLIENQLFYPKAMMPILLGEVPLVDHEGA